MKKTALYDTHVSLGAKMIEFAGWYLPVQYGGIIEEHENVRNNAGLFDVSHMGEIICEGQDAETFIQQLVTNDIKNMDIGKVRYTPMCYPNGGTVDDIMVYKFKNTSYMLVVNASNTDKDFNWMLDNIVGDVKISNVSDEYAQLAIQGPKALNIIKKIIDLPLESMKRYSFLQDVDLAGSNCFLSRTGYTGEDGFEIYMNPCDAVKVWNAIMHAGKDENLVPAGLGARDTLRLEAALPLYGHELSEDITPLEAGLEKFIKFEKENFIGKEVLIGQKEKGVNRKLAGFEMMDRAVPRNGYVVSSKDLKIGFVTSGNFSPTLKKNIGMALLKKEYCDIDTQIDVIIRNKAFKAKVVELPFYTIYTKRGSGKYN